MSAQIAVIPRIYVNLKRARARDRVALNLSPFKIESGETSFLSYPSHGSFLDDTRPVNARL